MHASLRRRRLQNLLVGGAIVIAAAGCSTGATPGATSTPATAPSIAPASGTASASQEPDTGTGATSGDVPDSAVFLTYSDPKLGYSIQYVEGWQVATRGDGVAIRDKDSSETIRLVLDQTDVAAFVSGTDLPALRSQAGFQLVKQDRVTINGKDLLHLLYDTASPPDAVTGKQVPQAVDRYYLPGTNGIAIVTLATPRGVDNVDAFRRMIESFRWA